MYRLSLLWAHSPSTSTYPLVCYHRVNAWHHAFELVLGGDRRLDVGFSPDGAHSLLRDGHRHQTMGSDLATASPHHARSVEPRRSCHSSSDSAFECRRHLHHPSRSLPSAHRVYRVMHLQGFLKMGIAAELLGMILCMLVGFFSAILILTFDLTRKTDRWV